MIRKILALVISLPILVLAVLVLSLVAEADDGAMNSIESQQELVQSLRQQLGQSIEKLEKVRSGRPQEPSRNKKEAPDQYQARLAKLQSQSSAARRSDEQDRRRMLEKERRK